MKNNELLNCYEALTNIANRSDIHDRFNLAKKSQSLKPHCDAIEISRVGIVQRYADKDGQKVADEHLPKFQKEYKELLDIETHVEPFLCLGDVQGATMNELLILKDVIANE